jgi:transposase
MDNREDAVAETGESRTEADMSAAAADAFVIWTQRLPDWVRKTFGWVLQTVLRPVHAKGFVALPKRWIVERTFAWLARHRRHSRSRDYERNPETSKTMIPISRIAPVSRRLAL